MKHQPKAYDLRLERLEDGPLVVLAKQCTFHPAERELLVRHYSWATRVIGYLARNTQLTEHDVEDATQDAVFAIKKAIEGYNIGEIGKPKGCPFRGYLRQVVTNRFTDFLRCHCRTQTRFGRSLETISQTTNSESWGAGVIPAGPSQGKQHDPVDISERREMRARLLNYVEGLQSPLRELWQELLSGDNLRSAGEKCGLSYDQAKRLRRKSRSELLLHLGLGQTGDR